jgi:hypothetical protein
MTVKTKVGGPRADALAERFLDLWLRQASLAGADPLLTDVTGRWLAWWDEVTRSAQEGGRAWLDLMARWPGGNDGGDEPAAGPASAGAASGGGERDLAELARRLAECQARLAALASQP